MVVAAPGLAHAADNAGFARRAVDQLVASQLPSGLFPYDFDFMADKGEPMEPLTIANIARQAGTAYGLGEYYLHLRDDRVRAAMAAALERFGEMSIPVGKSGLQSTVEWTRVLDLPFARYKLKVSLDALGLLYQETGDGRLVSADGTYNGAWAGTTALALLAELHYFRASGDDRFAAQRRGWLAGLRALSIPGGGFREKAITLDPSPYANGESWLSIAFYVDTFPDDRDAAAFLADLDRYFVDDYDEAASGGFFHWGATTAQLRFAATSDPRFAAFARTAVAKILDRPIRDAVARGNTCAMMEGLISAAATLIGNGEGDTDLVKRLRARIGSEMRKNRSLQIPPRRTRLDLGGQAFFYSPRMPDYAGAFRGGLYDPYVRIDLSQHCISALVKLHRFALGEVEYGHGRRH